MENKSTDYIALTPKTISVGIGVIMALTIGGGLSAAALISFIDFKNDPEVVGIAFFASAMILSLLVSIPNCMIILNGIKSAYKVNIYFAVAQIVILASWFILGDRTYILLYGAALLMPLLALYLMCSKLYQDFIDFFHHKRLMRKKYQEEVNKIKNQK